MAQRMVKKICQRCKEEVNLTAEQVESLKVPAEMLKGIRAFKGKGCSACNDTGKSGRTGIYEVMPMTPAIESLTLQRASDSEIRKVAMEEGMFSLRMAAVDKMKQGAISIDEVFAVTSSS
jgi:type IV pilus assembly protein PilB